MKTKTNQISKSQTLPVKEASIVLGVITLIIIAVQIGFKFGVIVEYSWLR